MNPSSDFASSPEALKLVPSRCYAHLPEEREEAALFLPERNDLGDSQLR
jgi:hypothetical protein